ncbi:carbon storage regulator CsrA [Paenibacillus sp.]|uniref:carbon storage regulator CsrA n=1 Tax=Paenibacillus sp. TaxID=58172 RepID=UPI002D3C5BC1|nr:carbon storage regulator CsrA [Paenibacillus sp.]HZG56542.1 carbon storage regulator CsrA [Paenibacillus sp.]
MLVLSRKKGDSIMIGDNVEITVIDVIGDQIRIGINAPKDVRIYRKEVFLSIQEANREAAGSKLNMIDLINARKIDK